MNKRHFERTLLLLWLCFASLNHVDSQNLLTKDQIGIKEGEYPRKVVGYFNPGISGPNCLWNFSNLEISNISHNVIQEIDSIGRVAVIDNNRITYYITRGDSLLEIGNETPLKEIDYYKPLCSMKYPLAVGDSITQVFGGYGIYCGDHYYKETGISSVIADSFGDIILSDRDTLKNVVRVYKFKSYSVAMDMEPSKIDSAQLKQVIEEKYEWYAPGYNKPVFESITSTSYMNLFPLGTTQYAYCYLPDYLISNSDNQQIEEVRQQDERDTQESLQEIIHYQVGIDGYHVNVNYSLDAHANVTMLIASQMGMTYFCERYTQDAGTGYHTDFNIGGLPSGVYILYINVNGKVYFEKIKK
ncbi:MAG: hypothetical protein K6D91_06945 [Prevotella sp.]|nr:hypothetical protein [Prevotella sp.]